MLDHIASIMVPVKILVMAVTVLLATFHHSVDTETVSIISVLSYIVKLSVYTLTKNLN